MTFIWMSCPLRLVELFLIFLDVNLSFYFNQCCNILKILLSQSNNGQKAFVEDTPEIRLDIFDGRIRFPNLKLTLNLQISIQNLGKLNLYMLAESQLGLYKSIGIVALRYTPCRSVIVASGVWIKNTIFSFSFYLNFMFVR